MAKRARRKTWSGVEWDGFQPVRYSLSDKVLGYTFTVHENNRQTDQPLHEILKRFREEPFENVSSFSDGVTVQLQGERTVGFKGTSFSARLLEVLLKLQRAGVSPFGTTWFYYDKVYALQDVMDGYRFFVVYEDAIVDEAVWLTDDTSSGFDPGALEIPGSEYGPIWSDEDDAEQAITAYWYRKFYTETKTGQVYMLSSRPRPFRTVQDIGAANAATIYAGVTKQLWCVIALLVLIALRLWFR